MADLITPIRPLVHHLIGRWCRHWQDADRDDVAGAIYLELCRIAPGHDEARCPWHRRVYVTARDVIRTYWNRDIKRRPPTWSRPFDDAEECRVRGYIPPGNPRCTVCRRALRSPYVWRRMQNRDSALEARAHWKDPPTCEACARRQIRAAS